MGGSVKAAGFGDGSWDVATAIAKLRLTMPHDHLDPGSSFDE